MWKNKTLNMNILFISAYGVGVVDKTGTVTMRTGTNILGGWFSDKLIAANLSVNAAR